MTYFLFFITKYAITRTTIIKRMPAATPIPIYTENKNNKKLHDNSRISMGIYTAIGKEEFVNLEVHSVSRHTRKK